MNGLERMATNFICPVGPYNPMETDWVFNREEHFGCRFYRVSNGRQEFLFPSVTTSIKFSSDNLSTHIQEEAQNEIAREYGQKAITRGLQFHYIVEMWLQQNVIKFNNPSQLLKMFSSFHKEFVENIQALNITPDRCKIEIVGVELPVFHPMLGVAGCIDAVISFHFKDDKDPMYLIYDWKTCSHVPMDPKHEHEIQIDLYQRAFRFTYNIPNDVVVSKKIVYVDDDGNLYSKDSYKGSNIFL